jgi:hypothetical protein
LAKQDDPGGEKAALKERLRGMKFELDGVTYDSYMKKLQEREGVVEERIMGEEFTSQSVQLRVTPLGKVLNIGYLFEFV